MTDHAELIERLRDVGEIKDDDAYEGVDPRVVRAMRAVSETMKQAATALAALVAERDRYREALEPFARAARSIDIDPPSDYEPSHGRGSVTAGDLRRARAALAQGGE